MSNWVGETDLIEWFPFPAWWKRIMLRIRHPVHGWMTKNLQDAV